MKSIFAVGFLVTMLFTAGTALSYDCYEKKPVRQRICAQCEKPRCSQPSCNCRCRKCDQYSTCNKTCNKKVVHKHTYQCKTTCTQKTKKIVTVQCELCGTQYPKGVDHYCGKVRCRSCGHVHARGVDHRCGMTRCQICGIHHHHGVKHHCGEIRCQSCGVHYHPGVGHHCRTRCKVKDCSQVPRKNCRLENRQCATQNCSASYHETKKTRWHGWFKNQKQKEA